MGNFKFIHWFLGLSFGFMSLFYSCQCNGDSDPPKDLIGVETFDTTYFSLSVIQSLMYQEGSEYLRFYNVSEDRINGDIKLLAVAVRKDSSEIYGPGTKNYILGEDSRNRHENPITLDRERAVEFAQNVYDRDDIPAFSAMVAIDELHIWCDINNCEKIFFVPATIKYQGRLLNTVEVKSTDSGSSLLIACPCPVCCPSYKKLLTHPNELQEATNGGDDGNEDDEDDEDDENNED